MLLLTLFSVYSKNFFSKSHLFIIIIIKTIMFFLLFHIIYLISSFILWIVFSLYGVLLAIYNRFVSLAPKPERKEKLLIIGGGFGGALVAKRVERYFETTLVSANDYFEFTPSILRTLTDPNHLSSIQIGHNKYLDLTCASIEIGIADKLINLKQIELKNGDILDFDKLVIATGSSYSLPIKESAAKSVFVASRGVHLVAAHQKLRTSQTIIVIGGGIVGVELAAEIIESFPKKNVKLLHSGQALCHSSSAVTAKAAAHCLKSLQNSGVEVIFETRVINQQGNVYKTEDGRKFVADMSFICTGITPNNEILKHSTSIVGQQCLDKRGFVNVDQYLRLKGHKHIYCVGDVAAIREEKLAQNAERQADVVVQNLLHCDSNNPIATYEPKPRPIIISLGRYDGVLIYKDWTICGYLPAIMKEVVENKVMVAYRWRRPVVMKSSPSFANLTALEQSPDDNENKRQ